MRDLLSLARRLLEDAAAPAISDRLREDLTAAADALRDFNAMLNAKAPSGNGKDFEFPDDRE